MISERPHSSSAPSRTPRWVRLLEKSRPPQPEQLPSCPVLGRRERAAWYVQVPGPGSVGIRVLVLLVM